MRCALYHPWVYLRGGAERVLLEIGRRSTHDWTLFTHSFQPAATFPELSSMDVAELRPSVSVRRSIAPLAGAAAVIAASRLPDIGAGGLLVSSEGLGDFVLARNRLPAVAYCHTPLKILHDPVTRGRLADQSPAKAAVLSALGPAFAAADRRLWRRYRHAFANSEEVRGRLAGAGLVPRGPVEVLRPGVDLDRFPGGDAEGGVAVSSSCPAASCGRRTWSWQSTPSAARGSRVWTPPWSWPGRSTTRAAAISRRCGVAPRACP